MLNTFKKSRKEKLFTKKAYNDTWEIRLATLHFDFQKLFKGESLQKDILFLLFYWEKKKENILKLETLQVLLTDVKYATSCKAEKSTFGFYLKCLNTLVSC